MVTPTVSVQPAAVLLSSCAIADVGVLLAIRKIERLKSYLQRLGKG